MCVSAEWGGVWSVRHQKGSIYSQQQPPWQSGNHAAIYARIESTNTCTHTGTQRHTQRQTVTDATRTHRQHTHSLGPTHAWTWGCGLLALLLLTCTLQRQTRRPGGSLAQPLSQSRCLKPGRMPSPQTPSQLAADQAGCAAL